MLILNCGGTFNKRYNPLNGELEVPFDSHALERILSTVNFKYDLAGVIFKDSLDMDANDRKTLAAIINESKESEFLLVHGTDTMDLTAEFLDTIFDDRVIVLTGAMKPFEVDKVEGSLNLGIAMGFIKSTNDNGVYICMNGLVEKWDKIEKNKTLGRFELV